MVIKCDETGYFEHGADVGIVGRGASVEAAFEDAAKAMFGVMVDLHTVRPTERVQVAFEETDLDLALVRWLNGLLAEADARRLALAEFRISRDGSHWQGEGRGEPWRQDLNAGVEVKGATLTMLSVCRADGVWQARCVVDV